MKIFAALAASFLLLGVPAAFAQTGSTTPVVHKATLLASVDMFSPQITGSGVSVVLISHDSVAEEAYIRVTLLDPANRPVIVKTANATPVTLLPNQAVQVNTPLVLPRDFSGTYRAMIQVVNVNGLPFATAYADKVVFSASALASAAIDSCKVSKGAQGVTGSCVVAKATPGLSLSVNLYRGASPVALMATTTAVKNGTAAWSFPPVQSGNYEIVAQLMEGATPVGIPSYIPLTISGNSARIVSVILDTPNQKPGTAALVTASFDVSGYGKGELYADAVLMSGGTVCGASLRTPLTGNSLVLPVSVSSACSLPQVTVRLMDASSTLDTYSAQAAAGTGSTGGKTMIWLLTIAAILGLCATWMLRRRRMPPPSAPPAYPQVPVPSSSSTPTL